MFLRFIRIFKTSIKTKVALTTFVTVSTVLILTSLFIFTYFRGLLRESIFSQQFMMASEIARQLEGRIELAYHQLSLAASDFSPENLSNPSKTEAIMKHHNQIQMIFDSGLLLISIDGRVIAESMGFEKLIGMDFKHFEYIQESLGSGKPYISKPFFFILPPHNPMIAIVVPIRDKHDRVISLLAGYHSLGNDQFLTNLSNQGLGSNSYLYLINDRTIIMHHDAKRIMEQVKEGENRGIDKAIKGFEGSLENENSKGQHLLSSFRRVGGTKWILSANMPYKEAFSELDGMIFKAALIVLVGIMLSCFAIWRITAHLTKPILQLISHVENSREDKEEWKPFLLNTGDEIERLAKAFNNSMDEVQNTKQMLNDEKNFFSSLIHNATSPMFVIDRDHRVIFWNSALERLTGFSSSQMIGTNKQWEPFYKTERPVLADLVMDHTHQLADQLYSNHSSSLFLGDSLRAEGWYDNLGGERRYIVFEAAPIKNNSDKIIAVIETLDDITDRKLSEEVTSAQNLFLQEIMDAIPNPVYYKNTKGVYLGCNVAFKAFIGKPSEEIIGLSLDSINTEGCNGDNIQKVQDFPDSARSERYETTFIRADGMVRNILACKAPFSNADGSLAGVVGVLVDITDRQQMSEQINKLSRAIEQSPATIVITDTDGVIEYVNPKFCQTSGYSVEEAIGLNPRILKSGEMSDDDYRKLWDSIRNGKEWRGEFHNKRKDGSLYWEFASISPLYDKDANISGYLAIKEDISERKAVESELRQSRLALEAKHIELGQVFSQVENAKREWEKTLDHLRDFIILTDPEHRIRRYNRLLAVSTGREINELSGLDWRELITSSGFHFVNFDGSSGEIFNQKSGRSYDVSVYAIEDSKLSQGYIVTINDTTELRAATQELQKAYAELKEAQLQIFQQEKMASIGQLAAGVAHEINNPMGFISSNLTTLNKYVERLTEFINANDQTLSNCSEHNVAALMETRKKLKVDYIMEDSQQLIAESQDGAGRVRRIVQDLMSFSRVDQPECALVSLNDALETTINIAWNEIKYIAVLKREFGDIPRIKCHPQQLNQVFLNLLINAGQAMGANQGTITVRTWCEADNVFVSVTDTGCGIPEEIRKRIFEPFFTTKDVGKGTGLGLSISYDIIKKHSGEIRVESEPGHGCTFIVTLPIDGPQQETNT